MRSAIEMASSRSIQALSVTRHLRLIWQDQVTRQFMQVAALWELSGGTFAFEYAPDARHERFAPLAEFPQLDQLYMIDHLPAFFANRTMSPNRRSFAEYCDWLGIDDVPTPIEILARSGGGRSTDTFHVAEGFAPINGRIHGSFFASGVRHVAGAQERLQQLHLGDSLRVRREPDNPANELALLLDAAPGEPIGYVPDWLLGDLQQLDLDSIQVTVERLNLAAPAHLQLMCTLVAAV